MMRWRRTHTASTAARPGFLVLSLLLALALQLVGVARAYAADPSITGVTVAYGASDVAYEAGVYGYRTVELTLSGTDFTDDAPQVTFGYVNESGETASYIVAEDDAYVWQKSEGLCVAIADRPGVYSSVTVTMGDSSATATLNGFEIAGSPKVTSIKFKENASATEYLKDGEGNDLDLVTLDQSSSAVLNAGIIEVTLSAFSLDLDVEYNSKVEMLSDAQPGNTVVDEARFEHQGGRVYKATLSSPPEGAFAIRVFAVDRYHHIEQSYNEQGYTLYRGTVEKNGEDYFARADGSVVIDRTAPTGYLQFTHMMSTREKVYVEPSVTVTVRNTEKNLDTDASATAHVKYTDGTEQDLSITWGESNANGLPGTFVLPSGEYENITVRLVDKAGSEATVGLPTSEAYINPDTGNHKIIVVDSTPPEVTLSYADATDAKTNTVSTAEGDITYVSGTRTYTIKVVDDTFYLGGMSGSIDASNKQHDYSGPAFSIKSASSWTDNPPEHTMPVSFDTDGQYVLSVDAKDSADNTAETVKSDTFVIDTESPVLAVVSDSEEGTYDTKDTEGKTVPGTFGSAFKDVTLPDTTYTYEGIPYYAYPIDLYPRIKERNFDATATTVQVTKDDVETEQTVTWKELPTPIDSTDPATRDTDGYWYYQTEDPVSYTEDGVYYSPHIVSTDLTTDDERNKADNGKTDDDKRKKFVIDLVAPEVKVAVNNEPATQGDPDSEGDRINFYDVATTISFAVSDNHGLRSVEVTDPDSLYEITTSDADAEGKPSVTLTLNLKDGVAEQDGVFDRDIKLKAVDLAGTIRVWTLNHKGEVTKNSVVTPEDNATINDGGSHPIALIQDTVDPKVGLSGVKAGKYYNSAQEAAAQVTEYNFMYLQLFAPARKVVTVTKYAPNYKRTESSWTLPVSKFSGTRPTYTATQAFAEDGHYKLAAQLVDYAGHASNLAEIGEFTIDTTAPKLSVTYKNDDGATSTTKDGVLYVSGKRTATIKVVEHNFDPARFSITTTTADAKSGYELPAYDPSAWSTSGDTHTYTIAFDTNGRYTLKVSGKDLAGNVAVQDDGTKGYQSGTFVVDSEKPVIAKAYDNGSAPKSSFDADAPVVEMPPPTGTHDGVAYYTHPVSVFALVKDRNLDVSSTTLSVTRDGKEEPRTASWGRTPDKRGDNGYEWWRTTVSYDEDGVYLTPHVTTADLAGNKADNKSQLLKFVVDTHAPDVSVSVSNDPSAQGGSGDPVNFYNVATSMTFTVTDNHALQSVVVDDPSGNYNVTAGDAKGKGQTTVTVQFKDGTASQDAEYQRDIVLTATDVAGNVRTWTIDHSGTVVEDSTSKTVTNPAINGGDEYPLSLIQDTVAPVVGLSGVAESTFYNTPQSVEATVDELNFDYLQQFDGARTVVTVTKYEGAAGRAESSWTVSASEFSGSKPSYLANIPFDSDGHYTLRAQFADYAGNLSNEAIISEFTIDMTAPVISLDFDVNEPRNEKYYKDPRTATVTVVEHNFDESLITIETEGQIGGWSSNGDTHTCTIYFGEGGPYTIKVNGSDQAGNEANEVTEPEFIVDLTEPEIKIAGTAQRLGRVSSDGVTVVDAYHDVLEDQNAYNGVVVPTITYSDNEVLSAEDLGFTLTGTKHGEDVTCTSSEPEGEKEMTQTIYDLGYLLSETGDGSNWNDFYVDDYTPDADDIYTLKATMTDQAGNEAEAELTFSVNRYGSNYEVRMTDVDEGELEEYERTGMLTAAPTILVREVNVSGVDDRDKDGNLVATNHHVEKEFANATTSIAMSDGEGAGYSLVALSGESQAQGWSEYRYTVRSANFGVGSDSDHEDRGQGIYRVNVMSDDTSSNANTTAGFWRSDEQRTAVEATGATTEFVLDELGPVIDEVNLPEHFSRGEEYQASFHVTDDISSGGAVEVIVDGRTLPASAVQGPKSGTGTYSFSIPAKPFNWDRNVKLVVRDYAGREATERNGTWFWQSTFLPEAGLVIGFVAVLTAALAYALHRQAAAEPELPLR